jgi:hypothetical protein
MVQSPRRDQQKINRIGHKSIRMMRRRITMPAIKQCHRVLVTLLVSLASARAQHFDITPLVGGTFGGAVKLEELGVSNFEAHLGDSLSLGISGGLRFDADECEACNVIEFRWQRQNSHFRIRPDSLATTPVPTPFVLTSDFRPALTIDRFLGDFTREWTIQETQKVRPYLTASVGVARLSTPAGGVTKFAFGIGTGVKIFPVRHWGVRFQAEYLPIFISGELERVLCAAGCVVVINGSVLNQFQFSFGPTFRF